MANAEVADFFLAERSGTVDDVWDSCAGESIWEEDRGRRGAPKDGHLFTGPPEQIHVTSLLARVRLREQQKQTDLEASCGLQPEPAANRRLVS